MMLSCAIVALFGAAHAVPVRWSNLVESGQTHLYTYDNYVAEFDKDQSEERRGVFEATLARIHAQNARNDTWTAGVNQFTDMTSEEFKAFYRGYSAMPIDLGADSVPTDLLNARVEDQPESVDWATDQGGKYLTAVKNQGGCGSCWAFSATESMESEIAINTKTEILTLAPQELVDCVPNPQQCGGTGGCQGATAELAFNFTKTAGTVLETGYPYTARTGKCELASKTLSKGGIKGFVKLPVNEYAPLMAAVVKQPISISVDASSWMIYHAGVFKGCPTKKVDIDHAVQLVGYGTDATAGPYFKVRNSWGEGWGEKGFIRVERQKDSKSTQCYTDPTPGDGNGCKGGPSTMQVCGACGILSDSSYPTGGYVKSGQ